MAHLRPAQPLPAGGGSASLPLPPGLSSDLSASFTGSGIFPATGMHLPGPTGSVACLGHKPWAFHLGLFMS